MSHSVTLSYNTLRYVRLEFSHVALRCITLCFIVISYVTSLCIVICDALRYVVLSVRSIIIFSHLLNAKTKNS